MADFRLRKNERLHSRTSVDDLFAHGCSLIAYPLRAVYRFRDSEGQPVQMMIAVPKKKIRKAVRRVLLRRRIRESYRLNRKDLLHPTLISAGQGVDIAFLYLSTEVVPYAHIETKMRDLLTRIARQCPPSASSSCCTE